MISEELYNRYFIALLQGNNRLCNQIVKGLLAKGLPPVALYTELFQRSLYQVGEFWEQNRISVSDEHLATATTERLLATVYPELLQAAGSNGRRAVLSCSVNEYHQLGARMVADIMESGGWDVAFLGANTPISDLIVLIDQQKPELLGLSISIYFNISSFYRLLTEVRNTFPNLTILVGGQAFRWGNTDIGKRFPMVEYVPSLEALQRQLPAGRP